MDDLSLRLDGVPGAARVRRPAAPSFLELPERTEKPRRRQA